MHPILAEIGPIKLYTYGVFLALAFILSSEYAARVSEELRIKSYDVLDLIIWVLISGIIGTRIAYIIMNIGDYLSDPLKIFKLWEGGLAWYGGVIVAAVTVYIWSKKHKKNPPQVLDLISLATILGLSIGRWGCFSAGCCYGKPTDFPTSVVFKEKSLALAGIPIHPTQIYEAVGMFFTFALTRGLMVGWKFSEAEKNTKLRVKELFEFKTDIFLLIELLLLRLYYLWYSKNIKFDLIIDFIFIPLFAILFYFLKYLGITIGKKVRYFEGIISAIFLISYGILRFFLEFLRDPSGLSGHIIDNLITLNHFISVGIVTFGLYIIVRRQFPFHKKTQ